MTLTASGSGLYLRALCSGINEMLDTYRQKIVEAESYYLNDPTLSLTFLFPMLGEYPVVFPYIYEITKTIQEQQLTGGAILNLLHEKAICGVPSIREAVLR